MSPGLETVAWGAGALAALGLLGLALIRVLGADASQDPRRAARERLERDAAGGGAGPAPTAAVPAVGAGATAPPSRAPLHFDPANDDLVLAIFAAHSAGDADFQRRVCVRHGLVDPRTGYPLAAPYQAYVEGIQRITTTRMDVYERFVREANGRWRAYAEEKLGIAPGEG